MDWGIGDRGSGYWDRNQINGFCCSSRQVQTIYEVLCSTARRTLFVQQIIVAGNKKLGF